MNAATHPTAEALEQMRQQYDRQRLQGHDAQFAVYEQIWLELARALAAQGVLSVEALAQRLEEHAMRAPQHGDWCFGLLSAAQMLRQPCSDPDSLVQ